MKKIIKLGMAALTALTMVGCSSGSASNDEKVLTVGISPDYAPYESENKKGERDITTTLRANLNNQ